MAIKYGFFDAIRSVNAQEEVVYDRAYTADDHNEYLNGLIVRNGMFRGVESEFSMTLEEHNDDSITFVDPDSGSEVTYDGYIAVNVGKGKAMVNGHWVINDSEETIYLHKRDIASKRIDMISLRWRMDQRDIILVVTKGQENSRASVPNNIGIPEQLGYIAKPENYISTDSYFEPVEDDNYGSTVEICLALVDVPARNASSSAPVIYRTVGESRCPWIAHILYKQEEAKENAMSFISRYTNTIKEWWEEIQEEGDMKANLTTVRYRITTQHGNIIQFSEIPEYEYAVEDTVNLYFNGLYLDDGEDYEIKVDGNQNYYIELKKINSFSPPNYISIEIYKGTALALPDAANIKY